MANPFTATITQVRVSMTNPKFVSYDYQTWQAEGHDACRADRTCAATRRTTSHFSLHCLATTTTARLAATLCPSLGPATMCLAR